MDIDPLQSFLDADPTNAPTEDVWIERLGCYVTVEAIVDSRDYHRLVRRCTIRRGVRGREREQFDGARMYRLLVSEYTVNPPLNPRRGGDDGKAFEAMAEKYGTSEPEELVRRSLYIGEIDSLAETILVLSGFSTDMDDAGN